MNRLFHVITIILMSAGVHAQDITGAWYGVLEVQQQKLHLVFHIKRTDNGYSSTMDSPDQGAKGMKCDTAIFENNKLTIEIGKLKIKYTATYLPDSARFDGTFAQGGYTLPLVLGKTKEESKPVPRPQDPVDFPYYQEEVTIKNIKDSIFLTGTLTLPKNKKADKIVILITGSGPQNRNEELAPFNHRPFLVLSDWLTRHGIGVLRYDDRGVGSSSGNFSKSTTADFANDAEAVVEFIRSRQDLSGMKIGLLGHSEGGMVAPMVAARNKHVSFIILMAGPGVPCNELMLKQTEAVQTAEKVPREMIDMNVSTLRKVYAYIKQHKGEPEKTTQQEVKKIFTADLEKFPPEAMNGMNAEELAAKETKAVTTPWFLYFISFEPAAYLAKIKCPVLAMNGTLDVQVDAGMNLAGIETALKHAKNKHFEIVPMAGLNHLFQKAGTGGVDEYGKIQETVNTAALEKISDWINKL